MIKTRKDSCKIFFNVKGRNVFTMGLTVNSAMIMKNLIHKFKLRNQESLKSIIRITKSNTPTSPQYNDQNELQTTSFTNSNKLNVLKIIQSESQNAISPVKKSNFKFESVLFGCVMVVVIVNVHFLVLLEINATLISNSTFALNNISNLNPNFQQELFYFYECSPAKETFYEQFILEFWFW